MFGQVLDFWFGEGEKKWFAEDKDFDDQIRKKFGKLYKDALEGKLDSWKDKAPSALALIIMLDQFSRNLYRQDPRAYAADKKALALARDAIRRGFDLEMPLPVRSWFYMPFMHAEDMEAQKEGLPFFETRLESPKQLRFAQDHAEVIRRFGRFPTRNRALKRLSTSEEETYLLENSKPPKKGA